MSAETNKGFIRQYVEALSGKPKDAETLRRFIADDNLREHISAFEAAFPQYEMKADELIAEGDKVVLRGSFRGTHRGELMGIAPTGKSVNVPLIMVYQVANETITDHWMGVDRMDLMQQLGVLPGLTAGAH
jgi:predicted ester cyclase